MKLTKLIIENFRGIKKGEIKKIGDINIFLGPNGSGKSTILESIFLLRESPESIINESIRIENVIMQKRNENVSSNSWWFKNKIENDIRISFEDESKMRFTKIINKKGAEFENYNNKRDELLNFVNGIYFIDSQTQFKNFEIKKWDEATDSRLDKKLIKSLNEIYKLDIETLTAVNNKIKVLFSDYGIYIDGLGAGMRVGFRLLLTCFVLKPNILLIEEIDSYQYPDSLFKLAKIICKISEENNIQFFLTTHSAETYMTFMRAADEKSIKSFTVYTLNLNKDGILEAKWSKLDNVIILTNAGSDLRKN